MWYSYYTRIAIFAIEKVKTAKDILDKKSLDIGISIIGIFATGISIANFPILRFL